VTIGISNGTTGRAAGNGSPAATGAERNRQDWIGGFRRFVRTGTGITIMRVLLLVGLVALWQVCVSTGLLDSVTVGTPYGTWLALEEYAMSGQMLASFTVTLSATAVAFVLGSTCGALAGYVLGLSPVLDKVFGILIAPLNSMPRIALAPLFLTWFGITQSAKVALAFSIVFFILLLNCRAAVKNVDPDIAMVARVTGLKGWSYLLRIALPTSVPALFAGLRLALIYSLLGVIASEMIASFAGVGTDIVRFGGQFNVNGLFAVLISLALVSTALNVLCDIAESRLLRWQDSSRLEV
jgi:NitT/TauT family transport system permease protein